MKHFYIEQLGAWRLSPGASILTRMDAEFTPAPKKAASAAEALSTSKRRYPNRAGRRRPASGG